MISSIAHQTVIVRFNYPFASREHKVCSVDIKRQEIAFPDIKAERKGDELHITPNKSNPGAPVVIAASRLARWLQRAYREGLFK